MARVAEAVVSIGGCIALVLGLATAPAAQTLESGARAALAGDAGPAVTHDDARVFLRSRDEVVRGIDRERRLAAVRDALDAELDRSHEAAARGWLRADNARLEEVNLGLAEEIEAERERRRRRWIRLLIEIPVNVGVTAVTGNPVIGAAVAGGIGSAVAGGDLDDVAIATFTRAATAGADHLVSLGIDQVSTAVADAVDAEVVEKFADLGLPLADAAVAEVTKEVRKRVGRQVNGGLHALAALVMPSQGPAADALNRVAAGLGVAAAGVGLLIPVEVDGSLDVEIVVQRTIRRAACGGLVCVPDVDSADVLFLSGLKLAHGFADPPHRWSVDGFGRLLTNGHYVLAAIHLNRLSSSTPTAGPAGAGGFLSIGRAAVCAVAEDVGRYREGVSMSGVRDYYLSVLERTWSRRCGVLSRAE